MIYLLRMQAMYACISETGCGFFAGVCAAGHRLPFSCDPPYPGIRELTLEDPPSCRTVWVYAESQAWPSGNTTSSHFGE
jgi:hypothetical protein